ncbi:hypothetical protein [Rhizomonospora bruguierae]|uniref:hypothetical protein n=1 Tax=Rhizomonospora bruguierae TaxID=1581705 RepID=UPI001BCEF008|nr:hypothetical protein [Micromonospora sp. NBRC 107566]
MGMPDASWLMRAVLAGMDRAGSRWCPLPSADETDDGRPDRLTILVEPAGVDDAARVLRQSGLIRLPTSGRPFLGLDRGTGQWIEVRLVTDLVFGHGVHPAAAAACLARRVDTIAGWALSAGDEFWVLLLRRLLTGGPAPGRVLARLKELRDAASLESPLAQALPLRAEAAALLAHARAGEWSALAACQHAFLAAWWRAHPLASAAHAARRATLRALTPAYRRRGVTVALLGADDAARCALAAAVAAGSYLPVRRVHLERWPVGGAPDALHRFASPWHRARGHLVLLDADGRDQMRRARWYHRPLPLPDVTLRMTGPGAVPHPRGAAPDRLDPRQPAAALLPAIYDRVWREYRRPVGRRRRRP